MRGLFFLSELIKVIDKHFPFRTIRVKGKHSPWISSHLISLFKEREKAWSKYRCTKSVPDWNHYKSLRNQCKTQTRNAKSSYYNDCFLKDFKNPRQFWDHLNRVLNRNSKTSVNQIKVNDVSISDPSLIAHAFNQHFTEIGDSNHVISSINDHASTFSFTPGSFTFNKIMPNDVFNAIANLKEYSSAGPDGIEARYIKLAAQVLIFPLADLFNLSLNTCTVPGTWKCAKVIPLFKSGDVSIMNNYRPISIICTIAKIFEKIIFNQLSNFIIRKNILCPFQSGFKPNFSTTTALLKFTNDIFSACDKGHLTGAIFIDLSKAFDMVDHYILLDKLQAIGLNQNALLWFNSYLHNRRQCVAFKGLLSDYLLVDKGVPQGSTLGPLLFSIFINDLSNICTMCNIHLYADDTVIYTADSDIHLIQKSLQTDFFIIQKRLHSHNLMLNMEKSCCMLFGKMCT